MFRSDDDGDEEDAELLLYIWLLGGERSPDDAEPPP